MKNNYAKSISEAARQQHSHPLEDTHPSSGHTHTHLHTHTEGRLMAGHFSLTTQKHLTPRREETRDWVGHKYNENGEKK